ncbi:MAG: nicotinamide mononucleotide transporter [Bacteroidetes bacterium]|nr:nicotinamide mononucleotide transporter [Bacteroidota bacterium]
MSWLEIIGFVLTILGVVLSSYQLIWSWPVNIISPIAYVFIFFQSKLYGDMALQFMFIALAIYGWINWSRKSLKPKQSVKKLNVVWCLIYFGISILLCALFYFLLKRYTNSDVPFADAVLTALSVVASIMAAKKQIENWIVWIAVDVAYVFLYLNKSLAITAILYGIITLLAVYAYFQWKKEIVK